MDALGVLQCGRPGYTSKVRSARNHYKHIPSAEQFDGTRDGIQCRSENKVTGFGVGIMEGALTRT